MEVSNIKLSLRPEQVKPVEIAMDSNITMDDFDKLGIGVSGSVDLSSPFYSVAMDAAAPAPITTPSVMSAVQFLQYFFPKVVRVVTRARKADELFGREIAGSWKDEQIVLRVAESIGQAVPYGDDTNENLASYNLNYDARTIVRFEQDMTVNKLEEERASAVRLNAVEEKRRACALSLAIVQNDVAFNGYNNGNNKTYGALNDPNLSAYVVVPVGASGATTWARKSFLEITKDIISMFEDLRKQTGNNIDGKTNATTMGIADAVFEYLNKTTDFGQSVYDFIQKNYPKCRLVAVPQYSAANGGANVIYLTADEIEDNKAIGQYIQSNLMLVGMQPLAKGFTEVYSNATAGVLVSQPIGVVRYSGV